MPIKHSIISHKVSKQEKMYRIIGAILLSCFVFCFSYAVYDIFLQSLFKGREKPFHEIDVQNNNSGAINSVLSENTERSNASDGFQSQGVDQPTSTQSGTSEPDNLMRQIKTLTEEFNNVDEEISSINAIESDPEKWQKFYLLYPEYSKLSHAELIPRLKLKGYSEVLSKLKNLEYNVDKFKQENISSLNPDQLRELNTLKSNIKSRSSSTNEGIFFAKSAIDFN